MNTIEELLDDLNAGITIVASEHTRVAANVIRVDGTPGPNVYMLNDAKADFALWTLEGTAYFKTLHPKPSLPWDNDITDKLARNDRCPDPLAAGWWQRTLRQITGLTFHHTLSDSPYATASYYVKKAGGRPSTCYTIWITETGNVLLCNRLEQGCWHDHTGHQNVNLSVGLAGRLHQHHPTDAQLQAAAQVAAWAVHDTGMNITLQTVRGHMDVGTYAGKTACPGWASAASGHWKPELYQLIEALL